MYKSEKKRCYIGLAISVIVFIIGQILLNYVSVLEKPAGGNTLYIITGTALILFSVIAFFFLVKHLFYLKKKAVKKRKSDIKFLNKNDFKRYQEAKARKANGNNSSDLIKS